MNESIDRSIDRAEFSSTVLRQVLFDMVPSFSERLKTHSSKFKVEGWKAEREFLHCLPVFHCRMMEGRSTRKNIWSSKDHFLPGRVAVFARRESANEGVCLQM